MKNWLKGLALLGAVTTIFLFSSQAVFAQADLRARMAKLEAMEAHEVNSEAVVLGHSIFEAACQACHGAHGDGNGPSSWFLETKPRNFLAGMYKWRTTPYGALPTDEDLDRTIRTGISGTDMFPFGEILNKKSRAAVIAYIKTFSPRFSDPKELKRLGEAIKIPAKRPSPTTKQTVARGAALFKINCVVCHGAGGKGDGVASANMKDQWGNDLQPWNFTLGYFKSGPNDTDIFRTISTGLNGTPMPPFAHLSESDRWALVSYVRSLKSSIMAFFYNPTGTVYY